VVYLEVKIFSKISQYIVKILNNALQHNNQEDTSIRDAESYRPSLSPFPWRPILSDVVYQNCPSYSKPTVNYVLELVEVF